MLMMTTLTFYVKIIIKEFLNIVYPLMEEALQSNETIDVF